jgi:signal transduction histidine kinase
MNDPLTPLSDPEFSGPVAELLQQGHLAEPQPLAGRELTAEALMGGGFLVTAVAMLLLLPEQRSFDLGLAAVFAVAYAVMTRVEFDVGAGYTVPTQLVFVPMLFALPPRVVPLLVAVGLLLGDLPDYLTGRKHISRVVKGLGDSWYAIGPVLVFSIADVGDPKWSEWPIYLGALGAQLVADVSASTLRERLSRGVAPRVQFRVLGLVYVVDVLLSPVGLLAAFASTRGRYGYLLVLPLAGLFVIFARERRARIENALGLGRAYQETAKLNAQLLETERAGTRARERLIAAASHEMQTPLAVLVGLLEPAARDELPPEQRAQAYATMSRQALRLRHLVRQFVDYTRLKAGRPLQFDARPIRVEPIVEEVAETQSDGAKIELELQDNLPNALVDPDRLHQILMNLVSNAIKFSPEGLPTRIVASSRAGSVEIAVTDRGKGINESDRDHLFEEFLPFEDRLDDPGPGLGLFMVRMLSEPQGLSVTVDSREGGGSTFTVVLPIAH